VLPLWRAWLKGDTSDGEDAAEVFVVVFSASIVACQRSARFVAAGASQRSAHFVAVIASQRSACSVAIVASQRSACSVAIVASQRSARFVAIVHMVGGSGVDDPR